MLLLTQADPMFVELPRKAALGLRVYYHVPQEELLQVLRCYFQLEGGIDARIQQVQMRFPQPLPAVTGTDAAASIHDTMATDQEGAPGYEDDDEQLGADEDTGIDWYAAARQQTEVYQQRHNLLVAECQRLQQELTDAQQLAGTLQQQLAAAEADGAKADAEKAKAGEQKDKQLAGKDSQLAKMEALYEAQLAKMEALYEAQLAGKDSQLAKMEALYQALLAGKDAQIQQLLDRK